MGDQENLSAAIEKLKTNANAMCKTISSYQSQDDKAISKSVYIVRYVCVKRALDEVSSNPLIAEGITDQGYIPIRSAMLEIQQQLELFADIANNIVIERDASEKVVGERLKLLPSQILPMCTELVSRVNVLKSRADGVVRKPTSVTAASIIPAVIGFGGVMTAVLTYPWWSNWLKTNYVNTKKTIVKRIERRRKKR